MIPHTEDSVKLFLFPYFFEQPSFNVVFFTIPIAMVIGEANNNLDSGSHRFCI